MAMTAGNHRFLVVTSGIAGRFEAHRLVTLQNGVTSGGRGARLLLLGQALYPPAFLCKA